MFLKLENINKMYDQDNGVKDINLEIIKGEFISLLGPSGCGKTTLLNLLGGFIKKDSGSIILEGKEISELSPEKRPFSTVFQNYALFSNYNVLDNIAYGIRYFRGLNKREARNSAMEYVNIVGLNGHENKPINMLSGGQQQRVALARGLATNPKVLLLDEPLSNLDTALRIKMRQEIKEIQKKSGITMIFVTHDQDEALSMSDRIAVMDKGRIIEIGTPRDIYLNPKGKFAASFVGKSNFIVIEGTDYLIRPENIELHLNSMGEYTVRSNMFLGSYSEIILEKNGEFINAKQFGNKGFDFAVGSKCDISFSKENMIKINS